MRNQDVCVEFVNGNRAEGSNMHTISNNKLYSYQTCICERAKDEKGGIFYYLNTTRYSITTSKHQSYIRWALRGHKIVEVKSVPIYATNLHDYAKK